MHRFLYTVSAHMRRAQPTCPRPGTESSAATDLAALYDTCAGPVYQYLFYRTLKQPAAESLTEQVFRRAFALVRDGLVDADIPLPWLFRLAESVYADQERPAAGPGADAPATAQTTGAGEHRRRRADAPMLNRAVACVSPEELQVVVLRFGQRLDRTEAARRLQVAPADVARLEMQALRTVSECVRILRDLGRTSLSDRARRAPNPTT